VTVQMSFEIVSKSSGVFGSEVSRADLTPLFPMGQKVMWWEIKEELYALGR